MSLYAEARKMAKSGKKPVDIARDLGINVKFVPFKKIKGIAISLGAKKFIFIDSELSEPERQFVCGHELGHFFLHPSTNFLFILKNTLFYSKQEYQANKFSCELMLGEKAEEYKYLINETASQGKLEKLVELVCRLKGREEDVP